jgi:hypothetical protein
MIYNFFNFLLVFTERCFILNYMKSKSRHNERLITSHKSFVFSEASGRYLYTTIISSMKSPGNGRHKLNKFLKKVRKTSLNHKNADKACGRIWECACGACLIIRKEKI